MYDTENICMTSPRLNKVICKGGFQALLDSKTLQVTQKKGLDRWFHLMVVHYTFNLYVPFTESLPVIIEKSRILSRATLTAIA